jgi:RimJ/RimL family protein N-acetyltransferase
MEKEPFEADRVPVGPRVELREVQDADLPIFFEHQMDPQATAMADFPSRDGATFRKHWQKVRANPSMFTRTILADGRVVGNLGSWEDSGRRLIGYWIGRADWGRGIASRALAAFLQVVTERPLHAEVAPHNRGSIRVLEKCGFERVDHRVDPESGETLYFHLL